MPPIRGGSSRIDNPYAAYVRRTAPAARDARVAAPSPASDVELSVRLFADGRSISVQRRTVEENGVVRTIGIDAVVR